jgi:CBS-domain-containing membrane protein
MYTSNTNNTTTLLFLDILTETAIITSLGASAMITFTMPYKYTADVRRLIGGYLVGIIIGFIFYLITTAVSTEKIIPTNHTLPLILLAATSVGVSIFIMTMLNTEHAPAAGVALGLVIQEWTIITIIFIIASIIWMTLIKNLLKNWMIDLT